MSFLGTWLALWRMEEILKTTDVEPWAHCYIVLSTLWPVSNKLTIHYFPSQVFHPILFRFHLELLQLGIVHDAYPFVVFYPATPEPLCSWWGLSTGSFVGILNTGGRIMLKPWLRQKSMRSPKLNNLLMTSSRSCLLLHCKRKGRVLVSMAYIIFAAYNISASIQDSNSRLCSLTV